MKCKNDDSNDNDYVQDYIVANNNDNHDYNDNETIMTMVQ